MPELIAISILTVLASAIGTMTGFGTSTIMVPVLLFFYPVGETLLFVGIIHWFGNVWKTILFRSGVRWKLVLAFGVPGVLFSYVGASLTFHLPETMLSRVLGVALICYVAFLIWKPSFSAPQTSLTSVLGGSVSGFIAGISGVGGAVRAAFLSVFNLPKAVYLFMIGIIGLLIDGVRVVTYASGGTRLPQLLLWGLLVFVPISYLGAKLGERMVHQVPEKKFRWIIIFFLFVIGIKFFLFP